MGLCVLESFAFLEPGPQRPVCQMFSEFTEEFSTAVPLKSAATVAGFVGLSTGSPFSFLCFLSINLGNSKKEKRRN